ncbi:MAG: DUF937 domain-containing protein [Thermomicrobiales bacterium]
MADSLLGQLSELATPQVLDQISKMTGVDTNLLSQGLGATGATALGSMASSAGSADGLSSLFDMVSKVPDAAASSDSGSGMLGSLLGGGGGDTNPLIGNLMNSVLGGSGAASASSITDSIMGGGINAISGTLSKALGFNVAPMLTMVAPALVGMVTKAVQGGNMDANGLKDMLTSQVDAFSNDPANAETAKLVNAALDAGKQGTAIRDAYTDAGWSAIKGAPLAAMAMVAAASPSKGGSAAAEFSAAAGAISRAAAAADPVSLLSMAFSGGPSQEEIDAVTGRAASANPLELIKAGIDQVAQGNAKEVGAYKAMILDTAQATAEASKEGGFLGIGGTQVSPEEQAVLDQLKAALA